MIAIVEPSPARAAMAICHILGGAGGDKAHASETLAYHLQEAKPGAASLFKEV